MKKLIALTAAVAAMAVLFSCEKKAAAPELSVNPLTADFEAAGGDKDIAVTSNVEWTVTASKEWVTVSPKSGNGNGTVKITVDPNDGVSVREADVTIAAGDNLSKVVKIAQLGQEPALAVSPESAADVAVAGADVDVDVTANVAWTASVPEGVDWITVAPASGEGTAKVKLTVAANASPRARNTTVTFTAGELSKTVSVAQVAGLGTRQTDSLALVAIYKASNGANWKEDRVWDLTKSLDALKEDGKTPLWYGVTFKDGRVTALKLLANTITAEWELPSAIGDLKQLTDLRINTNKLKGSIPEEVYDLTKLNYLYFQTNLLTGELSSKLGNLTELTEIYVNGNSNLAGEIPASVGNLKKLKKISVAETSVSGSIPAELAGCESLTILYITGTKISGELPDIWDKLPKIEEITLQNVTGLTGAIPASIGNSTTVKKVQLNGCNFTGNIPESFGVLPACTTLMLKDNKLKGVVPAAVQAHAKWQATTGWKYQTNILPQQDGYGLTLE